MEMEMERRTGRETEMEMAMEREKETETKMEMEMEMEMETEMEMAMEMGMGMEMWMEMAMEMAREMEMEMGMVMMRVMVICGARKARSELRFASKWLLTSDFEVLEASGVPTGDQESPESSQEAPKKLARSPQEAPKRLLGGALGALGSPKSSPSHDPRYIHRFPSLQEPSRRSPSHDLSALPTF